ncbi:uncharacterized protein YqhQ [Aequitasia blattaphilus]|uniref:DUF1385 domain-containing protein n=1 Tax=Aequitasia blattaphilus TaxID=2949332 RepID=A0ABT1E900_9FIRM|nr:DUF1385 domain-containing protein [Aequitasia blattaphilus]MCP1102295.1 DUF1385 domain-containing protein [Aequitasia blattaphilus]MCR8614935.1 DUF1385 domain-containing protein [Aequitasia blattaphilus]
MKRTSNIGGQAVLEGIMMRHGNEYALAVRTPQGEIAVEKHEYQNFFKSKKLTTTPFIRGVFNFIESMIMGVKTLMISANYAMDEDEEEDKTEKSEKKEKLMMTITTIVSFVLAIGIFMVLPYLLMNLVKPFIASYAIRTIIEGFLRIGIFVCYILLVSRMEDIQRTFMYHGAEHKCINCIEDGKELTVENVRESSRQHKRCGTSFIFFVLIISVILLLLIPVESTIMRIVIRLALMPVIAGISYELLKLAGRSENPIINLVSKPGLAIQKLTTKEPDDSMIEVAIRAVEEVFDWREFLDEGKPVS